MEIAFGSAKHVGFFYSLGPKQAGVDGSLLACQIIAIIFVTGWTVGMMLPFFVGLNHFGYLRVGKLQHS
jgi:hypothetical protein